MMERTPRHSAHTPTHVLVMDDTPAILELLQELLEEEGYRVTTCRERLDLPQIHAVHPDVIMQDLLFAGVRETGTQFLTAARLDPALAHIPIILCTAATRVVQDEGMAEQLRQLRVRVVLKPFDIDALLSVLVEARIASRREAVRADHVRTADHHGPGAPGREALGPRPTSAVSAV
jgi:two-component system response regulator MtrA